jgi:hypothetical protein
MARTPSSPVPTRSPSSPRSSRRGGRSIVDGRVDVQDMMQRRCCFATIPTAPLREDSASHDRPKEEGRLAAPPDKLVASPLKRGAPEDSMATSSACPPHRPWRMKSSRHPPLPPTALAPSLASVPSLLARDSPICAHRPRHRRCRGAQSRGPCLIRHHAPVGGLIPDAPICGHRSSRGHHRSSSARLPPPHPNCTG